MNQNYSMGIPFPPAVKWLVIANVSIWFGLQIVGESLLKLPLTAFFSLFPGKVIFEFWVWQLVTYMFFHSLSVTHILFNMLMLWFMGAELELRWGKKFFLTYYITCGVGAGIIYSLGMLIYSLITGAQMGFYIPVVGASGAIFGLMLAYGMIFGERVIYFFMVFPMKAKYFVMIMGVIQLANLMTTTVVGADVAYMAHLGGLITGYLFFKFRSLYRHFSEGRRSSSRRGGLRLVVDNEKKGSSDNKPKYWN